MYQAIEAAVSEKLGLKPEEIFKRQLSISEVIALSPTAINSIDILEAFAGTFAEHNLDDLLDLPAFTLDNQIDDVMQEIQKQLQKAGK